MTELPGLRFALGEDIDMLRSTVRSFAQAEIAPHAAEIQEEAFQRLEEAAEVQMVISGADPQARDASESGPPPSARLIRPSPLDC